MSDEEAATALEVFARLMEALAEGCAMDSAEILELVDIAKRYERA